jgi:S1-C subfamily serine protease
MVKETQPYKRSLSGSVGAGLGSLFGSSGKQYYILEHKINSQYHKVGESQEIIVDQIELGRDPKCQVRFDDSFSTVSRRHAAIVKNGENWKLVQLSSTNPTFLNGKKVGTEWYLQNGDEIQLSVGGPKLGFIIPAGNKSTVGSIGLSRRLSLFRQQALRPYKQAITILSIVLVLAIGGLSGWKIYSDREWEKILIDAQIKAQIEYENLRIRQDSVYTALETERTSKEQMQEEINKLKQSGVSRRNETPIHVHDNVDNTAIEKCLPFVYYIMVDKLVFTFEGQTGETDEMRWSGTGFLLDDGRFVTARHVIEAWAFPEGPDDPLAELNIIAHNGGKVIAHFTAYSSSGDSFSFTSEQFTWDSSGDKSIPNENGYTYVIATPDYRDWASIRINKNGGLKADKNLSTSLERGTSLTVLGFPLGLGANSPTDIQPIWGSGIAACQGLNQGVILTTDTNYEQGNSGGPVFCTKANGDLIVIGVVSAGAGRTIGFVVPIASIR